MGKHGRNIVARNLVKRRLREIGRRQALPYLDGSGRRGDVILRARWKAYEVAFEELAADVMKAVEAVCSNAD